MAEPAKLSITNQKGGVGKSTTSIHLAGALSKRGHDVLLVDVDPQGSATRDLGFKQYYGDLSIEITLADVLTDIDHLDDIRETIASTDEFDIVRANERMNEGLRTDLHSVNAPDKRLSKALAEVEEDYDYVIVDTPPSLDKITVNSAVYTKNLLVPTYPEEMSVGGLTILSDEVDAIQQLYPEIGYLGFVANRIEQTKNASKILNGLEEQFGDVFPIWKVRKRVVLQRAITESEGSIFAHNEDSEFELTYFDMAAWLDEKFDVDSQVELTDVFSEEEIRDAVTYGQIDPEDLEQIGEEVAAIATGD